ncbi:hypothetical protein UJ101_01592 [Flavobacteriaceae bacterium UJ101]|nr:hypothetical protein UJ101_01592 [Flavobacteriaceae bacterium UJ101]
MNKIILRNDLESDFKRLLRQFKNGNTDVKSTIYIDEDFIEGKIRKVECGNFFYGLIFDISVFKSFTLCQRKNYDINSSNYFITCDSSLILNIDVGGEQVDFKSDEELIVYRNALSYDVKLKTGKHQIILLVIKTEELIKNRDPDYSLYNKSKLNAEISRNEIIFKYIYGKEYNFWYEFINKDFYIRNSLSLIYEALNNDRSKTLFILGELTKIIEKVHSNLETKHNIVTLNNGIKLDSNMRNIVENVIEIVHSDMERIPKIVDLALQFEVRPKELRDAFKLYTGYNYRDWIVKVKMNKALEMLCSGKLVKDVAYSLGYSHPSKFTEIFKKYFKILPSLVEDNRDV